MRNDLRAERSDFSRVDKLSGEDRTYLEERGIDPGIVAHYKDGTSPAAIVADVRAKAELSKAICPVCGHSKPEEGVTAQAPRPIEIIDAPMKPSDRRGGCAWGSVPGVVNTDQIY